MAARSETLEITATDKAGHSSFIDIPITWTGTAPRFPGDPGPNKVIWGQTRKGDVAAMPARAAQYAQILGKPNPFYPGGFHNYTTPAQTNQAALTAMVNASVKVSIAAGMYVLVDVKEPSGKTFAQVGNGTCDAWIIMLITALMALGVPVILSYHNEPFNDGLGSATDWGNAFKRFRQIITSLGATNISLVSLLQLQPFDHVDGDSQNDPTPWFAATFPWCDLAGGNVYNHGADDKPISAWRTVEQCLDYVWDVMDSIAPNMPKLIGEWGVRTRSSDLTYATAWMDHFYDYGLSRGLVGAFFFDSDANVNDNSAIPWTLDWNGETSRLIKFAQQQVLPTSARRAA